MEKPKPAPTIPSPHSMKRQQATSALVISDSKPREDVEKPKPALTSPVPQLMKQKPPTSASVGPPPKVDYATELFNLLGMEDCKENGNGMNYSNSDSSTGPHGVPSLDPSTATWDCVSKTVINHGSHIPNGQQTKLVSSVPYPTQSQSSYSGRPGAPINGSIGGRAAFAPHSKPRPSITPTPSGHDYDFSSLTEGMFAKR
ncbi:hypothetical protein CRG98_035973 [Punica granatum]|uniref:Uncharacterized protein n=1 Tax=Punica granatum TaxID=22663 RepID=A0A2I0II28_PUNGR|nr:hypothetical protein CRG98_035973 [Punica granatum]